MIVKILDFSNKKLWYVIKLDYIYFNWSKIYFQCLDLAKKIKKDKFFPDLILGLARGGLIVARLLSDFLTNAPFVQPQIKSKHQIIYGVCSRQVYRPVS